LPDLLRVSGLRAGYGEAIVIDDVAFALGEGRSLALLGRNGTGKTTLLATLVGVTRYRAGSIELAGRALVPLRPDQRAGAGLGWVPQERNIFRSLTVLENLTAVARAGPWTPARAFAMFPRLLLLDEPLEGLAPLIVQELLKALTRIVRDEGLSAIIVEQNPARVLAMTDDAVILERGSVVHSSESARLAADAATLDRYLAVGGRAH